MKNNRISFFWAGSPAQTYHIYAEFNDIEEKLTERIHAQLVLNEGLKDPLLVITPKEYEDLIKVQLHYRTLPGTFTCPKEFHGYKLLVYDSETALTETDPGEAYLQWRIRQLRKESKENV